MLTAVDWPPPERGALSAGQPASSRANRPSAPGASAGADDSDSAMSAAGSEGLERFASAPSGPLASGVAEEPGSPEAVGAASRSAPQAARKRPANVSGSPPGEVNGGGAAAAGRAGSGSGSDGGDSGELPKWARQLAVFRFAAQDWAERLWQVHAPALQVPPRTAPQAHACDLGAWSRAILVTRWKLEAALVTVKP